MIQESESMVEFSLPAHDGSVVRSSDLAGRAYLLYFYPRRTPRLNPGGLPAADSWSELQDLGLEVLGVSYDSPETNRQFAAANHLPFRLLSDRDRSLAAASARSIPSCRSQNGCPSWSAPTGASSRPTRA